MLKKRISNNVDLAELKGQIAMLKKCQAALTPENEALLAQVKAMGLL